MEEAEIPLPSEETTPPVTKIYLVPIQFLRHLCFLGVLAGQVCLLHVLLSPQPARLSNRPPKPVKNLHFPLPLCAPPPPYTFPPPFAP